MTTTTQPTTRAVNWYGRGCRNDRLVDRDNMTDKQARAEADWVRHAFDGSHNIMMEEI